MVLLMRWYRYQSGLAYAMVSLSKWTPTGVPLYIELFHVIYRYGLIVFLDNDVAIVMQKAHQSRQATIL